MSMDAAAARALFATAPVARLATVGADRRPHVVPITFALDGDTLYTAVDHKPKRTTRLRRLENLAANPRVASSPTTTTSDWSALWWVRADGEAASSLSTIRGRPRWLRSSRLATSSTGGGHRQGRRSRSASRAGVAGGPPALRKADGPLRHPRAGGRSHANMARHAHGASRGRGGDAAGPRGAPSDLAWPLPSHHRVGR